MKVPYSFWISILSLFLISTGSVSGQSAQPSLDEVVGDERFWMLTPDQFMSRYQPLGFRWNSAAKDSARLSVTKGGLTVKGQPVGETIVTFSDGKPSQIQISIHNRGDDGEINQDEYEKTLKAWNANVTTISGASPEDRGRDNQSAVRADGWMWKTGKVAYLLEYSFQKEVRTRDIPFRSEFIRLRVAPYVQKGFMEEKLSGPAERVKKGDLPANVVKKDGDVFIQGIPMVDQGQKGYCVVATASRVFQYYDINVDQHEMAQIADSSAEGGTSSVGMIKALEDISGRFKVRIKTHDAMEYDDMIELAEDYNKAADRADKPPLPIGNNINLWYHFDQFDPEVLKATRLRSSAGIKRFQKEIERTIDAGIPLLWTVTVGIFEEPKRISQSRGGHMRMIIGYNTANNEIIFTDSWGAGHEFKRWGIEEAFCSTKGIYSIQPTM